MVHGPLELLELFGRGRHKVADAQVLHNVLRLPMRFFHFPISPTFHSACSTTGGVSKDGNGLKGFSVIDWLIVGNISRYHFALLLTPVNRKGEKPFITRYTLVAGREIW